MLRSLADGGFHMTKQVVLIPLDGTEFSRQIFPEVVKFIDPDENELVLLRVAHPPKGLTARPTRPTSAEVPVPMYETALDVEMAYHPVYASQEWDSAFTALKDELQADAEQLEAAGFVVHTAVRFGNPAQEIVNYIAEENANLIAMTTHGRSGLSRVISGSVAETVTRHVTVPVLMLRSIEPVTEGDEDTNTLNDLVAGGHLMRG
jgi:nucleotide-binding universal stress UspA family protein